MPGSQISNAPENNGFAASFTHLKLKREQESFFVVVVFFEDEIKKIKL